MDALSNQLHVRRNGPRWIHDGLTGTGVTPWCEKSMKLRELRVPVRRVWERLWCSGVLLDGTCSGRAFSYLLSGDCVSVFMCMLASNAY